MVKLITSNIVGTASKITWSQAQTVNYDDHQALIVMQLHSDDKDSLVDLTTVGVEILSEIERKMQTTKGLGQIKSLVEQVSKEIKSGLMLDILVASVENSTLSIYGQGNVESYLARDGKLAKLGIDTEGELKDGDVVVVSTHDFMSVVGSSKFKDILMNDENPAELLAPLVHMKPETSLVAAIVGEVKLEKDETRTESWWRSVLNREPKIKLKTESPRKVNFWVGVVILLLLIIMIGVGMVRRVKVNAEANFWSLNSSISAKMSETLSIGELNPERARVLLSESKNEVEAYLATDITDEYKQKGKKLLDEIARTDEKAFKKNDIHLNTVVELSILADGLVSSKMKGDGKDNLIFNDSTSSQIVAMNLVDRSRQIIEIPNKDNYVDLGIGETKVYALNSSGVTELFWKKESVKKVIEPDEFWKDPFLISMFAGNAYILDREQGEIWKYPTLGEAFGSRRRWFAVGITPDLTNVVDMKVVGDVWLLTSTGKLARYSRGAPQTFNMEGFPAIAEAKKLSDPRAIWVSDSAVYVLESGASRVVVFGVDGKYQAQYANSEFSKASDLVIVDNKGYVLIDNMVKEFGL